MTDSLDPKYNRAPRHTMDFFEHQDRAKARSRKFVLLYALAVALICIALATVAALVVYFSNNSPNQSPLEPALIAALITAAGTALLITAGSAHRIAELRGGGSTVARSLGGILIDPSTQDPQQRQLLNIVEEMSIASGVPVPPVYFMPNEKGINAFAAGYTPGDAVIGVTHGCLNGLKRDELQGVIAHEFSHILNGDMKLNIRMIGFLNGILLLTIIGHLVLRYAPHTARQKNGVPVFVVMIALAISMLVLGSIGALAAKLIQASVSRQREFLADASAVQFTRNPEGIANALRRLASKPRSTKIRHPRAQESSHMFFGEALNFGSALATHPPLKDRIKRINPQWDGTFLPSLLPHLTDQQANQQDPSAPPAQSARERLEQLSKGRQHQDGHALNQAAILLPLLALSGTMSPVHIDHARAIIHAIPEPLRDAAHDISSARAVVYALLLDRTDNAIRTKQLDTLDHANDPALAHLVDKLAPLAIALKPELRLPLLDMTLGALAHLTPNQHQTFRANVTNLIRADRNIDLFEWVTSNTLTRHLDQRFGITHSKPTQYYALGKLGPELSTLLSAIARAGITSKDPDTNNELVHSAFKLGAGALPVDTSLTPSTNLTDLDNALTTLTQCTPRLKQQILKAAALTAAADRHITTTESELLRAIADALGVPTPPLLPGQQLT